LSHWSQDKTSNRKTTKTPTVKTAGRPPQAILHDYCERVLKTVYEWSFSQDEGSYIAEVFIGKGDSRTQYGKGVGRSKKEAKKNAAEKAILVLMPQLMSSNSDEDKMKEFADLDVDDKQVVEMSDAVGVSSPYMLLCKFVQRHKLLLPLKISFDVSNCHNGVTYVMTCGQHRVEGLSTNKQTAKNVAAQRILQLCHPDVLKWADLLRLYSKDTEQTEMVISNYTIMYFLLIPIIQLRIMTNLRQTESCPLFANGISR
jgi:microprocessor complex subunit DGCR8